MSRRLASIDALRGVARRGLVPRVPRGSPRRADSPLRWDETYRVIDTGELTIDQVIGEIVSDIEARRELIENA